MDLNLFYDASLSQIAYSGDHPDLWDKIYSVGHINPQDLVAFINLLNQKIAAPITNTNTSRLTCIAAVCLAALGKLELSHQILENLFSDNSSDLLIAGALFYVKKLMNPDKPKYQLHGKLCKIPFRNMDILEDRVHLCCANYLPVSIGNMQTDSWEAVWNSNAAQEIRKTLLDGTYRYCNKMTCPVIQSNGLTSIEAIKRNEDIDKSTIKVPLEEVVNHQQVILKHGPTVVNLSYDSTCNLSCPSCRTIRFAANEATRNAYQKMQNDNILPLLHSVRLAFITGSGDPFASKNFRQLLMSINKEEYPQLKLQLSTNALLLTEKEWNKFSHLNGMVNVIRVSIDGISAQTHEATRRGSNWQIMEKNMAFIGTLLQAGHIDHFEIGYVVQDNNYHEMGAAVDYAKKVGADLINFTKITNWGTFTTEQFAQKFIFNPTHPMHADFLQVMQDVRLKDRIVDKRGLIDYVT